MTDETDVLHDEEDIDGCLCDNPVKEEDATPDEDLPITDGGVA